MAALASLDDIINRLTGGAGAFEHLSFFIDNRIASGAATATVAGRASSLWRYNKFPGGEGAVPSTAAVPVNDTNGALFQADPGGGREKWLLGIDTNIINSVGGLLLYDRLSHQGGLSGTVTTAQTTNLPTAALTRNTGGVGNRIFLEIYTAIGATNTTVTASYTNQAGTSGRTTKAASVGGTGLNEATRMIELPLQDGDTGVQAVASVTLAATTGTAGNFGVTLARPLISTVQGGTGVGSGRDLIAGLPSITELDTDACLAFIFYPNATTAPQVLGCLHSVEA